MKIIEKNILEVEKGIICHQVNCQKVMGKGIALSIRNKWPIVYEQFLKYYSDKPDIVRLGNAHFIQVSIDPRLEVCNIYGQLYYGNNGRFTDYGALKSAFNILKEKTWNEQIYFPYLMGCMNGGGDWNIVSKMIEFYFPNAIICKLPEKKS